MTDEGVWSHFWRRAKTRREWQILAVGLILWASLLALLIASWASSRDLGAALSQAIVADIFAGREAGIPLGVSNGVPPLLMASASIIQDLGSAALVYPIFLFVLHRYHDRNNRFMRRLRRIEEAAARHEKFVRRWGPLGVFLFMLLPFLVNGPLVGAAVGRLAGIHTKYLIAPVAAAVAVAAFTLSFGFEALFTVTDAIHPAVSTGITIAIIAVVFIGFVIGEAIDERRHQHSLQSSSEE